MNVRRYILLDNGGRTADRYTILDAHLDEHGQHQFGAFNERPFSPDGFGQHGSIPSSAFRIHKREHFRALGRRTRIETLGPDAKRFAEEFMQTQSSELGVWDNEDQEDKLVFHAATSGGKYEIKVFYAPRHGVRGYSYKEYTSGEGSGGGWGQDQEGMAELIAKKIRNAEKYDKIRYIVQFNELGPMPIELGAWGGASESEDLPLDPSPRRIHFLHSLQGRDMHHAWSAFAGQERVAMISEIKEGAVYEITYYRRPDRPDTQPSSTTRRVQGDLTHAQNLVLQRGWR
jgi:hypothetical protein